MEPDYQNARQEGYYNPKRCRSDSNFLGKSASNNPYRKGPPSKKSYKKKINKYRPDEILKLKDHKLSKIQPQSELLHRKLLSLAKRSEITWRLVPKVIKSDFDEVTKTMKSLLNKLTPTNFDPIKEKIAQLFSPESSKVFSNLLITKACMEVKYVETYAQLTCDLTKQFKFFRVNLIESLQNVFESNALEAEDIGLNKRKVLGCVCFLGELMNRKFMSVKVGVYCCEQLLKRRSEEAAEGVCYLLSACERFFGSPRYKEVAHDLICELQSRSQGYSSRVKFQIEDLFESRKIHKIIMQNTEKPYNLKA